MKKILLSLHLLFFAFGLQAQVALEVPQTQVPVITKIAATWCPPCGSWGWTFFENLLEDNSEKAVIFVAHHSGDLINEVASALTTNYGATYQPEYYLNGIDQEVNSGNTAAKRLDIQAAIEEESTENPIVQVGLDASIIGGESEFTVQYSTKFFQNTIGEYYLGIYLIEKQVIANQASIGPYAEHENVLRKSLIGDNFGVLLASGDIDVGTGTEAFLTIPLEEYDVNNLEIIAIIWQKIDDKYIVVNANKTVEISETILFSTEFNQEIVASFKVNPNLIQTSAFVEFTLPASIEKASIQLLNVNGKQVATLYQGALIEGENRFAFTRREDIAAGIYFIQLRIVEKIITKKVIIK